MLARLIAAGKPPVQRPEYISQDYRLYVNGLPDAPLRSNRFGSRNSENIAKTGFITVYARFKFHKNPLKNAAQMVIDGLGVALSTFATSDTSITGTESRKVL
jgi:hypothetical protein